MYSADQVRVDPFHHASQLKWELSQATKTQNVYLINNSLGDELWNNIEINLQAFTYDATKSKPKHSPHARTPIPLKIHK